MKTVIQVVQHLAPGGIEVMALEILRLQRADVNMLVVSLEGDKGTMLARWPRLKAFSKQLIFLNKKPGWRLKVFVQLAALFLKNKADAVHSHHIGPLIYAGLAARLVGVKNIVHTEHDAWHLENSKRLWLEKTLCKLVRPHLVADSSMVAQSLRNHLGLEAITMVRNGVDTDHFCPGSKRLARQILMLPSDVKLIGCAGRMEVEKGQIVLLQALRGLADEIHIAFAGSGSQEKFLKEKVNEWGLQQRVHFLGHVDEMVNFYRALDVFCLSSYKEGMPLAPLEAQACNIPTVLSNTGACIECICPETGALVKAGDHQQLAITLKVILNNKNVGSPRQFICQQASARRMTRSYNALCLTPVIEVS